MLARHGRPGEFRLWAPPLFFGQKVGEARDLTPRPVNDGRDDGRDRPADFGDIAGRAENSPP
jgi:hypothetical protein